MVNINNFMITIFVTRISAILASPPNFEDKFGQVVHVSAVFRHGNRAPETAYPRDPYKHYAWPPDGLGELTMRGKRRAYELGKWFRSRYKTLLERVTTFGNISVQSSTMDRTIMSAELFLATFYPPNSNQTIEKGLAWQPVPIFTIPEKYDNLILLFGAIRTCPRALELIKEHFSSKEVKKKYDKYARTMRYLKKHTGYELSKENMLETVQQINKIYDVLLIQRENGFKLPPWTRKVFPRKLRSIKIDLDMTEARVPKIQRFYAGPFFKSLTKAMNRTVNNNTTKIFNFYSGHDSTIIVMMMALGIYNNVDPPYSSALIFELRQKSNEKIVTVFYSNSTSTAPHFVEIPKCKSPCTFEKFVNLTSPLMLTEWKEECRAKR